MDFSLYQMTPLEQWICQKYREFDINHISDLNITYIADMFGGQIDTTKAKSHARWIDNEDGTFFVVYLQEGLSEHQTRKEFFHEVGHPLLHVGDQHKLDKLFVSLQERQASHVELYAAMPFYLIENAISHMGLVSVKSLAYEFNLPEAFVQKRMNQIIRRVSMAQHEKERADYQESQIRKTDPLNWSNETWSLLLKLYTQKAEKQLKGAPR